MLAVPEFAASTGSRARRIAARNNLVVRYRESLCRPLTLIAEHAESAVLPDSRPTSPGASTIDHLRSRHVGGERCGWPAIHLGGWIETDLRVFASFIIDHDPALEGAANIERHHIEAFKICQRAQPGRNGDIELDAPSPHRFPVDAELAELTSAVNSHVGGEPAGRAGDDLALVLVKVVQQELEDQMGVLPGCRCKRILTRLEQNGVEASAVFGHRLPGDPASALQPFGGVRQFLVRRHDLTSQHRHAHPTPVAVEAVEDFVVAVGHAMALTQLLRQDVLE